MGTTTAEQFAPDVQIRSRSDYAHKYAPQERSTNLADRRKTRFYPEGTGRATPQRYGSNAQWDLGLCLVHFNTPDMCKHGKACDYRHEALTPNERSYIGSLEPEGPEFLVKSDNMTLYKEG